jgi:hypothetical protein
MYVCMSSMYVSCGVYVCMYVRTIYVCVCVGLQIHIWHTIFRTKFKRSNELVLKISYSRTHCERVSVIQMNTCMVVKWPSEEVPLVSF